MKITNMVIFYIPLLSHLTTNEGFCKKEGTFGGSIKILKINLKLGTEKHQRQRGSALKI